MSTHNLLSSFQNGDEVVLEKCKGIKTLQNDEVTEDYKSNYGLRVQHLSPISGILNKKEEYIETSNGKVSLNMEALMYGSDFLYSREEYGPTLEDRYTPF